MFQLRSLLIAFAAGLAVAGSATALAQQAYPVRPVRIVVPYPPGGSVDFLARLYGPKLTDALGRQFVIDNRPGGNTVIGNELVAKANPDGYTLLVAGGGQISIALMYRNIPYDVIKDFAPIAGIARSEFVLVVNPGLPVNTVADLIALAKKRPGELNYGTSSTGGPTHLAPVQFEMLTGTRLQQVPYKGAGPAMIDLVGGQIQLGFANPAGSVGFVRSGKLRAIAVTGEKRIDAMPDVPTFAEAGVPGLSMRNWYSLTGPAGMPQAVVNKLAAAVLKAAAMPEVKAAIVKQGLEVFAASASEIDTIRRDDLAMISKLIKAANIRPLD